MPSNGYQVIDSDAHVVETPRTWEYIDASEAQLRPNLLFSQDMPPKRYWQVDGKIRGLQPQSLSEMELEERSRKSGKNIVTPQAARGNGRRRSAAAGHGPPRH